MVFQEITDNPDEGDREEVRMQDKLWTKKPESSLVHPDDSPRATTMALHDTVEIDMSNSAIQNGEASANIVEMNVEPSVENDDAEHSEVAQPEAADEEAEVDSEAQVHHEEPMETRPPVESSDPAALKVDADEMSNIENYSEISKVGDSDNSEVYLTPTGTDDVRKGELHSPECNYEESVLLVNHEDLFEVSKTVENLVSEVANHVENCSNAAESMPTDNISYEDYSEPSEPSILPVDKDHLTELTNYETLDDDDRNGHRDNDHPDEDSLDDRANQTPDTQGETPSTAEQLAGSPLEQEYMEDLASETPDEQFVTNLESVGCEHTELPIQIDNDLCLEDQDADRARGILGPNEDDTIDQEDPGNEPEERQDIAIIGSNDPQVMQGLGPAIMDIITNGNIASSNDLALQRPEQISKCLSTQWW